MPDAWGGHCLPANMTTTTTEFGTELGPYSQERGVQHEGRKYVQKTTVLKGFSWDLVTAFIQNYRAVTPIFQDNSCTITIL